MKVVSHASELLYKTEWYIMVHNYNMYDTNITVHTHVNKGAQIENGVWIHLHNVPVPLTTYIFIVYTHLLKEKVTVCRNYISLSRGMTSH